MTQPAPTTSEAARTVNAAITAAVEGDDMAGGAEMLLPLMTSGVGTLYALIAMLAAMAGQPTREQAPAFERPPLDVFPPEIVFATRFTAAWTARDHDQAEALFSTLYRTAGGQGEGIVAAVVALFHMAAATETRVVREQRAARGEEPTS